MQEHQQDILVTIIISSVFFLIIGVFLLVVIFLFLRKQRNNHREKEEMRNQFEKTLLTTQIEIQDETLSYIAKEIHDNVGQILFLAKLNNNQINKENAEEKSVLIDDLLSKAFNDLRNISHSLKNNSFHQIGFAESLDQLLQTIEHTGKYKTSYAAPHFEEIEDLMKGKEIILFRIIQECINNILKHAEAKHIEIKIQKNIDGLQVDIIDDGMGFEIDKTASPKNGIGLQNIYSRAKLINTSVNIQSEKGQGTKVSLTLKP